MKKYILLLLCFIGLIEYAQGQTGNSSEVGITEGQLSVSLTGAATYSIPIAVPPGINGIVPQISLAYSSQGGNGIAGYGWNISGVSSITRIPATKFHDNTIDAVDFDNSDRFAFDGQRLFVKSGTAGVYGADGTVYETESFSNIKITSHGVHPSGANYGPEYFTVEYPDGSVAHYGDTAGGNGISRSLTEWSITYWENPQHVRINYFYDLSGNSLYLNTISYGTTVGFTPINHIFFEYDNRVRPEQGYVGGQSVTKEAILKKILSIGNGTTIRNYILDYDTTSLGYQRLVRITEKSGDESKSYNPTVFNYDTTSNVGLFDIQPQTQMNNQTNIDYTNTANITGDFDGDGKTDLILYKKSGVDAKKKYWFYNQIQEVSTTSGIEKNEGLFDEIFATTLLTGDAATGYKLLPKQGWTVVKKGSATDEILFNSYVLNAATGNTIDLIDSKSYTFPSITYTTQNCNDIIGTDRSAPVTHTLPLKKDYLNGDFNGDGLTDVIAIDKKTTYYSTYCDANLQLVTQEHTEYGQSYFINLDKRVSTGYVTEFGPLNLSGEHKYLVADVNGDGKSDILDFSAGSVHVYSLSDDEQYLVSLFTKTDSHIVIDKPILLGDYNGDGKMDFVIPQAEEVDSWSFFLSDGLSFIKTNKAIGLVYRSYWVGNFVGYGLTNNTKSLDEFVFIANDFNGDGKTDILLQQNLTAIAVWQPGLGWDYSFDGTPEATRLSIAENTTTSTNALAFTLTNTEPQITGVNRYPIPIFMDPNKLNQNLEYALVSGSTIRSFKSTKDHRKDVALQSITTGNGVAETITYNSLKNIPCTDPACNSVYNFATGLENYPNVDIIAAPAFKVVSQIEKQSATVNKKQLFAYYGGVSNVEGLGFLGFRATMRTNWFNDTTSPISSVSRNDVHLRGANIENYTALGLIMPENQTPATDFISKSNATYNIDAITGTFDPPLQSNKVFKLKNTIAQNFNGLDGTSSETRIGFDNFNNPTHSSTTLRNEAIIEQVTESTVEYDNSPNAIPYHIGRPTRKIQKVTIYPNDAGLTDTTDSEELYAYDNNLLSEVKKKGYNTDYIKEANKYDAYGNIIRKTITAPYLAPRTTNYEYDPDTHRFLTKSTDIEGLTTEFTYDSSNGLLLTELLPSNPSYPLQTTYEYDVWGKKRKISDYLGKTKTISYIRDYASTYIITNSDDGSSSTELFDDLGRKTAVYSPDINLNSYLVIKEYDIYDRPIRVSEPLNPEYDQPQWNETQYDVYGRVTSTHAFTDKTVALTYNGLTTTVDDGIKQKTTVKNAIGNAISVTDQPGGTIRYAYFANGHLRETEFEGAKTTIEQDGWGRKIRLSDPSAGTNEYKYNNFGETLYEKNENGETYYDLDIFGKVIGKKIVGIGNDTNSQTKYSYNGTTKLLEGSQFDDFTAGTTTNYSYEYDNYRRLYVSSENSYQAFFQRGTLYDDFGRPERELYTAINTSDGKQSSKWIRNTYKNSFHWQILDEATNKVLWQTDAVNARGQLTDAQYGNGIGSEHHDYDSFGLPKATTFTTISGGNASSTPFLALYTSFDAKRGNLLKRSNSMFNWGEAFKYDDLDRLVMFNNELGVSVTQDYNNNGSIKANTIGEYAYTNADKPFQVSTVTPNNPEVFEYYSTRKQDLRFNAFKKPITIGVEGAEQIDFEYNDFNSRAVMYYGSSDDKNLRPYRKFYAADGTMEIKRNVANNTVEFITYIGGDAYTAPLVLKSDGTTPEYLYLHRDYQGTILAITNADGKVVEKRLFDAWGALIRFEDANGKREGLELEKEGFMLLDRGYTGHEHLLGVGLINMNGRLYDPKLHRFLSPDNNVQDSSNTQNFNRYGYCINNPLKYRDLSGESFWSDIGDGFSNAFQAVLNVAVAVVTTVVSVAIITTAITIGTTVGILQSVGTGFQNNSILTNEARILGGLFQGNIGQIVSRFTKELPQTMLGLGISLGANALGRVRGVNYYGGATVVQHYSEHWGAFTLGSYINGDASIEANPNNRLFQHEYGHYLQSQEFGLSYMRTFALPSLFDTFGNGDHRQHFAEQDANSRAFTYFNEHVENYNGWDHGIYGNPINGYNWSKPYNDIANQLALSNNCLSPKWYRFEF